MILRLHFENYGFRNNIVSPDFMASIWGTTGDLEFYYHAGRGKIICHVVDDMVCLSLADDGWLL